jgi:hypothetical protein
MLDSPWERTHRSSRGDEGIQTVLGAENKLFCAIRVMNMGALLLVVVGAGLLFLMVLIGVMGYAAASNRRSGPPT